MFFRRGHNVPGGPVLADIHHFKAMVAQHEADYILANVVDVAFHGGHNHHRPPFAAPRFFQKRLQPGERGLHGLGRTQQLGQKIFFTFIFAAHFGNGRNKAFVDQVERLRAGGQGRVHQGEDFFLAAFDNRFRQAVACRRRIRGAGCASCVRRAFSGRGGNCSRRAAPSRARCPFGILGAEIFSLRIIFQERVYSGQGVAHPFIARMGDAGG